MALNLTLLLFIWSAVFAITGGATHNWPIIGIMTQETPDELRNYGATYLPASCVKFVESAGARVVPIFVNQTNQYYEHIFSSINGLLLPGGGLDDSLLVSGYGRAGKLFYDIAMKSFDENGDHFPIWGTCQGLELLVCLAAGKNILQTREAGDENLNITLSPGYEKSGLLGQAPEWVLTALTQDAITYNFHKFGISPTAFRNSVGVNSTFNILSTSLTDYQKPFVSTMEGKTYPFYGVQYHPEKPMFVWVTDTHIKHDSTSIKVYQYFADHFISEARKSSHQFKSPKEEEDALIYNYCPVYVRGKGSLQVNEIYFFD